MTTGERIRAQRKSRNLTLQEVGDKLGITKAGVYKYEKGIVTNIPVQVLNRLAEILECSPAYLMGWSDDNKSGMDSKELFDRAVINFDRLSSERQTDCVNLLRYLYPELFDVRD